MLGEAGPAPFHRSWARLPELPSNAKQDIGCSPSSGRVLRFRLHFSPSGALRLEAAAPHPHPREEAQQSSTFHLFIGARTELSLGLTLPQPRLRSPKASPTPQVLSAPLHLRPSGQWTLPVRSALAWSCLTQGSGGATAPGVVLDGGLEVLRAVKFWAAQDHIALGEEVTAEVATQAAQRGQHVDCR